MYYTVYYNIYINMIVLLRFHFHSIKKNMLSILNYYILKYNLLINKPLFKQYIIIFAELEQKTLLKNYLCSWNKNEC